MLFNIFNKRKSDWKLDIDGVEKGGCTAQEVESLLDSIRSGKIYFIVLTPAKKIDVNNRRLNFVQICKDEDDGNYHFEVSTSDINDSDNIIIYGKEGFAKDKVTDMVQLLMKDNIVPDCSDWKVVFDSADVKIANVEVYRELVKTISDNEAFLQNMDRCFCYPREYFKDNADRYEYRGITSRDAIDTFVWIAVADEMLESGIAIELDWKEEKDEFLSNIEELTKENNLVVDEGMLDDEGDIPSWCKELDNKWMKDGYCVAGIDIDSDSYVLFVCKTDKLKSLTELAKSINHRIDFAQNM
jgi:hypothetical protein|nr:DUF6630 family protein [uncultured Lachnoanaerobaculum sp.]